MRTCCTHFRLATTEGVCRCGRNRPLLALSRVVHFYQQTPKSLSSTGIRRGSARQPRGYPRPPARPAAASGAAYARRAHTHSRAHPSDAWQRRLSRGRVAPHASQDSAKKGHGRRAWVSARGAPRPPRAARQLGRGALRPAQCSHGRRAAVGAHAERLASLPLSRYKMVATKNRQSSPYRFHACLT